MNGKIRGLDERRKMLGEIIQKKQKGADSPVHKESVYAISHGRGFQYYKKEECGIRYVKAEDRKWVEKTIQHEYDAKILNAAENEIKIINKLIKLYSKESVEDIYSKMPKGKRELIVPDAVNDEEFLDEWKKQSYTPMEFRDGAPEYYSAKGERMRSKSEVIIANLLNNMNIDYKYEKPLKLKNIGVVHPDFTILNCAERKEIYWEHFGMLDDQTYRNKAICKIRDYEQSGYFLGDRLIVTEETIDCPLDIKSVERRVRNALSIIE